MNIFDGSYVFYMSYVRVKHATTKRGGGAKYPIVGVKSIPDPTVFWPQTRRRGGVQLFVSQKQRVFSWIGHESRNSARVALGYLLNSNICHEKTQRALHRIHTPASCQTLAQSTPYASILLHEVRLRILQKLRFDHFGSVFKSEIFRIFVLKTPSLEVL